MTVLTILSHTQVCRRRVLSAGSLSDIYCTSRGMVWNSRPQPPEDTELGAVGLSEGHTEIQYLSSPGLTFDSRFHGIET
ncbi:hypothetical protein RRG08_010621 [Elysia crispata]|uniref:Uncharacterized protein n=1 Tax=Elysia crispata TaxID=231223 RepID=A0AAE1AKP7_9GAST|nr:hypothetical protein RRG08_010621 [Elysia crispata]